MNFPTIASVSDRLIFHSPTKSTPVKILQPHASGINCCSWDSQAQYLATGGEDSRICVTSVLKMQPYFTLTDDLQKPSAINSLGFSSNNLFLASGNNDGSIKIWDLKNRTKSLEFCGLNSGVSSIDWNSDSCFLAGGTVLGHISVYNMSTNGEERYELSQKNYDSVKKLQFSPFKSNLLASSSSNGFVRLWKLQEDDDGEVDPNPVLTFNEHKKSSYDLAFSPKHESLLCSVGHDNKINFYDLAKGTIARSFELPMKLSSIAFDPSDNCIVVGAMSGELIFIDLKSNKKINLVGHKRKPINGIACCDKRKMSALYENYSTTSGRKTFTQSSKSKKLDSLRPEPKLSAISKRSMQDLHRNSEKSQKTAPGLGRPPSKSLMGVVSKKRLIGNYIEGTPSLKGVSERGRSSSNLSCLNNKDYMSGMEFKMSEKMRKFSHDNSSSSKDIGKFTNIALSRNSHNSSRKSLSQEAPPMAPPVIMPKKEIPTIMNIDDERDISILIDKKLERNNDEMKEFFHEQIQALHLDIIRQLEFQNDLFKNSLKDYADKYNNLQEKYDQLLLENEKLKKSAF